MNSSVSEGQVQIEGDNTAIDVVEGAVDCDSTENKTTD